QETLQLAQPGERSWTDGINHDQRAACPQGIRGGLDQSTIDRLVEMMDGGRQQDDVARVFGDWDRSNVGDLECDAVPVGGRRTYRLWRPCGPAEVQNACTQPLIPTTKCQRISTMAPTQVEKFRRSVRHRRPLDDL